MKKQLLKVLLVMMISVLVSCQSESTDNSYKTENPNLRRVLVKEVIQSPDYTYVKFKEANDVYWAAVGRNDNIKKGGTYYFDQWMEMNDFKSKALNRTFKTIYFIDHLSDKPFPSPEKVKVEKTGSAHVNKSLVENVGPAKGGITLATLLADTKKYNGKTVIVRGQVVKYTPDVLKMNWLHIQDGTQANGKFDLAITTHDTCKVGDILTFKGKIILNKDFGYGYSYDVLMEDAKLIDRK
ncbi:MAG TPA: hypothetical protein ENH02_07255 [Bacteroidetes bacterium]|nr:hypothetical protein [Bacteroidota bacterium]